MILWIMPIALLLLPIVFYLSQKGISNLNHNLEIASKILKAQPKSSFLSFYKFVEGNYKGRKIIFKCNIGPKAGLPVIVTIMPHVSPKESKVFMVSYPQPTQHTSLRGKEIFYQGSMDKKIDSAGFVGLTKACSEEEIIAVFDELTKAVEIVESGQPYFKT